MCVCVCVCVCGFRFVYLQQVSWFLSTKLKILSPFQFSMRLYTKSCHTNQEKKNNMLECCLRRET